MCFAYFGKLNLLIVPRSIIDSSQFTLLPQLPLKTTLELKVVKIDSKIKIIFLHYSKSVTHSVSRPVDLFLLVFEKISPIHQILRRFYKIHHRAPVLNKPEIAKFTVTTTLSISLKKQSTHVSI